MNLFKKIVRCIVDPTPRRRENVRLSEKGEEALKRIGRGETIHASNVLDPREKYIITRENGLEIIS